MIASYRLHYAPDNASLIIRLVLEELGEAYETSLIDRSKQGQTLPGYLALNPNGLIPVLETPAGPIFETAAILLWLTEHHGQMAPQPGDTDRAGFLKWLFFISNTLHTSMRMTFYPHYYVGTQKATQSLLRSHMQGEIARHLDKLEVLAADQPRWLGGNMPSCLDFYLACLLRWLSLYPALKGGAGWFHLPHWPQLHKMAARLEHCQSVQAAIRAEGLGPNPFTAPDYATPPEGSAT